MAATRTSKAAAPALHHDHYASVHALRTVNPITMTYASNIDKAITFLTREGSQHSLGMSGGAPAVLAAMVDGFPEGEKKIDAMHAQLVGQLPIAVGLGRRLVRGMTGDELDVHAVNRGDIGRAWSSRQRAIKRGNSAVKIVCDIGGNSGTSAESLSWRGVAAIVLHEIMSTARYSTELVAAFGVRDYSTSKSNKRLMLISCVVKGRGVSADRGLLAATLTLGGFFRTVGFLAIVKGCDSQGERVDSGLGHHIDCESLYPPEDKITTVFVPSSIDCSEAALTWIKQTVALLQSIKGVI